MSTSTFVSQSIRAVRSRICITRRCFSIVKNQHVNEQLSQQQLESEQIQSLHISQKGKYIQNPVILKEYRGDGPVKRELDAAKESTKILAIIENNHNNIRNAAIYGKAMQKCNVLHDYHSVHKIMKLMCLNSKIKPGLIEFHVFMNSMARSNWKRAINQILKTFTSMINEYHLTPDIITFSIMFKALRRAKKYEEAEKIFRELMMGKYHIEPCELVYSQMIAIYADNNKFMEAHKLFYEYIDKAKQGKLQYNLPVINAYLNACNSKQNFMEMTKVMDIIQETDGLSLDKYSIANIMKSCIAAGKYKKCVKVFEKWIGEGNEEVIQMLYIKCRALAKMIMAKDLTFEQKCELYRNLEMNVADAMEKGGIGSKLKKCLLEGCIYLYADKDPMEIVKLFESLVDEGWIGYIALDHGPASHNELTMRPLIDIHGFQWIENQFILRYLFTFKLDEILKSIDYDGKISIIVGVGKGKLKKLVMEELKSWDPSIACKECEENKGKIIIEEYEVKKYECDDNHAKSLLCTPSQNWHHLN